MLLKIYDSFKPVFYNKELLHCSEEKSIDAIFLFKNSIAWTYPSSNYGEGTAFRHVERREKSRYFWEESLEWVLKPSSVDMYNLYIQTPHFLKNPQKSKPIETWKPLFYSRFPQLVHKSSQLWWITQTKINLVLQENVKIQQHMTLLLMHHIKFKICFN